MNSIIAYCVSIIASVTLFILSILYQYINAMELAFFAAIILWLVSFGFAIKELYKSKIIGAGMIVASIFLGVLGGFTLFIVAIAACVASPEC